jgi:hypothetical protein
MGASVYAMCPAAAAGVERDVAPGEIQTPYELAHMGALVDQFFHLRGAGVLFL